MGAAGQPDGCDRPLTLLLVHPGDCRSSTGQTGIEMGNFILTISVL